MASPTDSHGRGPSRRALLGGAAGALAGAAVAGPAGVALGRSTRSGQGSDAGSGTGASSPDLVSPYGPHQPGVTRLGQSVVETVALDLDGADAAAWARLLRVWTGDIAALTQGRAAPGDTAPGIGREGHGLTVTVGLGPRVVAALPASRRLRGLSEVPAMRHDRLQPQWSGGDALLVVAANDGTTTSHAVRRLLADASPFGRLRWHQVGSWNAHDATGASVTGRNHFDQVDGTGNPSPGTADFDRTVWVDDGPWSGGTTVVVRRIRMDLDTWDTLTVAEQERSVGRRLSDGAPLTGARESDPLDLAATDGQGRLVIAENAHARVAHPTLNGGRRIFRKGVNYAVPAHGGGIEYGLVFSSYQADVGAQFVPIQHALDVSDALNAWTTAIGSASFAILPGMAEGSWLGEGILG